MADYNWSVEESAQQLMCTLSVEGRKSVEELIIQPESVSGEQNK